MEKINLKSYGWHHCTVILLKSTMSSLVFSVLSNRLLNSCGPTARCNIFKSTVKWKTFGSQYQIPPDDTVAFVAVSAASFSAAVLLHVLPGHLNLIAATLAGSMRVAAKLIIASLFFYTGSPFTG